MKLNDIVKFLCHDGTNKECAENIQICFKNDEWDDYEEVNAASPMITPFLDCDIECIGAEKSSLNRDTCCIRVSIDETKEK